MSVFVCVYVISAGLVSLQVRVYINILVCVYHVGLCVNACITRRTRTA